MTNDELRLLWARWLAADPLTPEEQRALTSALEDDAELRDALLDDLDLDGALRGLAEGRRRADAFNRTMADVVAPERDATRFVRKVELALAGPPSKPPSSTKIPSIRATNRFTRRGRRDEGGGAIAWRVGLAAAALFALVVVGAVGRPTKAPRPTPPKGEVETARTPAPAPRVVEEKRLRRLAILEQEQARLEEEQPKPEDAPEDRALRIAEVKSERETIEAEMRLAIDSARSTLAAPSASVPNVPATRDRETQVDPAGVPARDGAYVVTGFLFARKPTVTQYGKGMEIPDTLELLAHRSLGGTIQWKDGTRVELQPGASFRVAHAEKARRVHLVSGTLDSQIAKQPADRPMIFETAQSESQILGTTIRLTAHTDASIGTTLEVREGRVKFGKPGGKPVEVGAGYFAVAATGVEPKAGRNFVIEDEIRFVFGPADVKYEAARFKLDSGQLFDTTRGYGWKPSLYARVPWKTPAGEVLSGHVGPGRNQNPKTSEPHRQAHVAAGWGVHADTWTMPLPNGRYQVTVGVGDWCGEHGPNRVTIEDKVVVNDVMTKLPTYYAEFPAEIVVKDGELTMVCGGTDSKKLPPDKSVDTILNYLVIKKLK